MKDLMEKMMNKEKGEKMDEKSIEAKKATLMELIDMMKKLAGKDVVEGMQKVTVAAPDKEGLKEGLEKAEDVVEMAPDMEEMMPEEDMGEEVVDDSEVEEMPEEDEEEKTKALRKMMGM